MTIGNKKISLANQVFVAMILGAVFGLVLGKPMTHLEFIGNMWLNAIKMIIVPMILTTVITGIISQKDLSSLRRISSRIVVFYLGTTVLAALVGIAVSYALHPGLYANFAGMSTAEIKGTSNLSVENFFLNLISSNIFKSFTENNILQTLIISVLFGIAILKIKNEEHKESVRNFFTILSDMIFSLINMIMAVAPVGVFFLMASSFGKYGTGIFTGIAALVGTYYIACLVQLIVVYGFLLIVFAKVNPFRFIKDSMELWIYTISTCSSVAAIPVAIKVDKEKFGISERVSGFTVPLGSQINHDGSVLLYCCVIVFISEMIGYDMTVIHLINLVFLSTVISLGGGGIPGSGIVKLMIMVQAVGLPIEIVGVIAAFYRLFDMGTTTNNSMGDLAGTIIIGQAEKNNA